MKEKLIIKNFGPIRNVELEFGRFNVLIGENATGKSTVAKVLAMCRYFSYIFKNDISEQNFENGLSSWRLSESVQNNTYIFYECRHYSFKIERIIVKDQDRDQEGNYYEYDFPILSSSLEAKSKEFENLLDELKKIQPKSTGLYDFSTVGWRIPTSFFQNDVARVMDKPFYFYTERGLQSLFSLGKSSIPNISDSLYNYFAETTEIASLFKQDTSIPPLEIVYRNENGVGKFRKRTENEFFNLENAASGYKSVIPIVLTIESYINSNKPKTFIIEEPELNLFPEVQQKLMQYLVDRVMNNNSAALLTTHSPYTLTSLNNMMYAFQVGETYGEKIKQILPKRYWLNPYEVSVYMMLPNGECENILDKEGLIKAEKIDSVSAILNKDFNAIMDIELNIKE